jgi:hypothetical protein
MTDMPLGQLYLDWDGKPSMRFLLGLNVEKFKSNVAKESGYQFALHKPSERNELWIPRGR